MCGDVVTALRRGIPKAKMHRAADANFLKAFELAEIRRRVQGLAHFYCGGSSGCRFRFEITTEF